MIAVGERERVNTTLDWAVVREAELVRLRERVRVLEAEFVAAFERELSADV